MRMLKDANEKAEKGKEARNLGQVSSDMGHLGDN